MADEFIYMTVLLALITTTLRLTTRKMDYGELE